MNVLSLFDGMSCGQLALERANVSVDNYYACEIDKYAMQIATKIFLTQYSWEMYQSLVKITWKHIITLMTQ